jgi:hypothetical protein
VLAAATIGVAVLAAAAACAPAEAQTPKTFSVPFEESQTTLSKEGQTVVGAAVEIAQECSEE